MKWFGWKKRCQQLEAENRQLRERNAWLSGKFRGGQPRGVRCRVGEVKHQRTLRGWFVGGVSGDDRDRLRPGESRQDQGYGADLWM